MERFAGGSINVICGCMLLPGVKPEAELIAGVNRVFQLNDALRIRISEEDGQPSQQVIPYTEKNIEVLHFASKAELDSYAQKSAEEPFDFYGNLCNIQVVILPDQYGLLVKFHHIVGDAWTIALMGTQFNTIMNGEEPSACSYCEYVESEKEYLESQRHENDRTFFLEQFKKCDEVTYLSEKQAASYNATRKTFVLDAGKTQEIKDYATQSKSSAYALFMTSLAIYMNRTNMNAEKFYLGTAVLNRSGVREKRTMGMFVNTVPMLIELENGGSFADNLAAIGKTIFSAFRHQKFNYGDVLSAIRKEYSFSEKLYDVMLSYQNATITGGNCETTWYHCGMQNESLQIHIDDRDREGVFRIHYDYQTDKFAVQEIEALHNHLMTLLQDAIENDTKKLYELELLPSEEKKKVLFDFNNTAMDYPRDKCVHQLFEEQVAKTPNKIALIACDKTLTYAELNEQANCIAYSLVEKGVMPGNIVAFALSRKSYLIATMLGILKAGAAYLPINANYPQDRIDYMLTDSKATIFVTEDNIADLLHNKQCENLHTMMDSSNLCYCIYTSGSTGRPKAVAVSHQNVHNFILSNAGAFQSSVVDKCECMLATNSIVFDITVQDILLPLLNGLSVTLSENDDVAQIAQLATTVPNGKTGLIITPTKLQMYMQSEVFCANLSRFSVIMVGAETFPGTLFEELRTYTNAVIYNGYGPTETTCGVLYAEINDSKDITIGKPIANTQIYIVDKHMGIVPIGVTGELCIAGDGVGAGYLNRPELTAEKFVDNPFGEGKLYKTGDLAYWREDGNIVYVGRNDFQVKIRGLRIELGEIENAIDGIDGISQAVVVVRKNSEGRQLVCAFYTGNEVDAKEIRNHIGKKLPKYMLPHIFTHLNEMPLTSSGKVNRKALPEVDLENITNDAEYVPPENKQQKLLCGLMEQILDVVPVGIADDFFDLGGDSLKAIEFVSKAHNEGIYFNLQNAFDYPTVKELWECIENGDRQEISFTDVDFTAVNAILEKNKPEYITAPKKCEVGDILLAGATGYLGIHILADFLENDTGTVYCLVRGKDLPDSTARLNKLLDFYFGDKYVGNDRIQVICADLQKDSFGLDENTYAMLLSAVDTVINTAASVKHYGSYKYFYEANVETTKRLIDFCKGANAKLIHTSTLSVSGNSFGDQFDGFISEDEKHFYESSLYIEQPLENVYARSKFEAEKAVLDAMADGLKANIMRMGNLTNRLADGMFQKNYESNAFLQRVKGVLELGMFPEYLMDLYAEFTPIDEAASAVMTIARHFNTEQTVFHINSIKVVYFDKLFQIFNDLGFKVDFVSGPVFTEALRKTAEQTGTAHIFETFINDMDKNNRLVYDSNIRIENDFTVQYLRSLGFEWSDIGMDYLRKYVTYFKTIGYM